jgi:tRNA(Ile)-lysidine synthase
VARVEVGTAGGPEAAARSARYEALDAIAEKVSAAAVLLGHTRDDQAETVLLGLARGSGARSLAGMAARSGPYRRPFLGLERSLTHRACAEAGLAVWEDPHNLNAAYTRVRVRHGVLPVLEHELGPGVAAALARTAEQLRDDADALDAWATRACEECLRDGGVDVAAIEGLPAAVRRRVLRRAALAAGSPATDLAAGHLAAVDALVTDWHGQAFVELPGGIRVRRVEGWLELVTPE